jgi:SAM-dependent methyltransferase
LELGCGTGRVLLELAQAGHHVVGIDRDSAMLDYVRSKANSVGSLSIELLAAEISDFRLQMLFPLVIIPSNTFSYLEAGAALQSLDTIRRHLADQGLLVLDLPNPKEFLSEALITHPSTFEEPLSVFIEPSTNLPVQVYARERMLDHERIVHVTWNFDLLHPDGTTRRFDRHLQVHLREADEMIQLLKARGYSRIELMGDYTGSPSSSDSPRLLVLARKGKG